MKALDTNILVRFLVQDDAQQAEAVYQVFKNAEKNQEVLFVPLLVVLETLWVLESVYEISRKEILDALDGLLLMPILKFQTIEVIFGFIDSARQTANDLSDLLIAHAAKDSGCRSVLTFDKKASKFPLFELLTTKR